MVSGETKACILSTNRKNVSSISSPACLRAPRCQTSTWWATSIAADKTAAPTKLAKTLLSSPTQTSLLSIGRNLATTGLALVKTLAEFPALLITSLTTRSRWVTYTYQMLWRCSPACSESLSLGGVRSVCLLAQTRTIASKISVEVNQEWSEKLIRKGLLSEEEKTHGSMLKITQISILQMKAIWVAQVRKKIKVAIYEELSVQLHKEFLPRLQRS